MTVLKLDFGKTLGWEADISGSNIKDLIGLSDIKYVASPKVLGASPPKVLGVSTHC